MMRLLIAAGVALMLGATPVFAQGRAEQARRLELAERYVAAWQGDQLADTIASLIISMTVNDNMSPEDSRTAELAIRDISGPLTERLLKAVTVVYAETFTMEELLAVVDFYESDIGRSVTRKTHEASPRVEEAMMAILPQIMNQLVESWCTHSDCTSEERARMAKEIQEILP